MSMFVHSSFKRMISPPNFAMTIALLFVLARKDRETACLFISLLDPFQINIKAFIRTICCIPKNEISAMSLNSAPFRISAAPLRTVCTRKLNIAEPFSYFFFSLTKKSYKVCQSDNGFWPFRLLSRGWGKECSGKKNSKKGEGVGKRQVPAHTTPLPAALFKANSNSKLFTSSIDSRIRMANQITH